MPIVATASKVGRGKKSPAWRQALKEALRDPVEICRLLDLPDDVARRAAEWTAGFPVFAPRSYLSRMRRGDLADPLLRQILPVVDERVSPAGFTVDPVDDRAAEVTPGLLHKYRSRVLLITTGACAVHCRYCFRRSFPYASAPHGLAQWQPALEQIAENESLREVILSGGDPLTLLDEQLTELARRLAAIPHVRRLRVHTRLPIMIPERVTDELIEWLRGTRLTPIMVVHANHPAELDDDVAAALARLADAGIPLLNQAVLLAGVNDDADVLAELCERLVELRVMPYYLHQLDRVAGAAHFEVPREVGLTIMQGLRARLPGYAVPRYVHEVAGREYKIPLE